jgi:hypothetical protein
MTVRSHLKLSLTGDLIRKYTDETSFGSFQEFSTHFANLSNVIEGRTIREQLRRAGFSIPAARAPIFHVQKDEQVTSSKYFAVYKVCFCCRSDRQSNVTII